MNFTPQKLCAIEQPTEAQLRELRPAALLACIRDAPPVTAHCEKCNRVTHTAIVALRSGDISALCAICRARRGRGTLGRARNHNDCAGTPAEVSNGNSTT